MRGKFEAFIDMKLIADMDTAKLIGIKAMPKDIVFRGNPKSSGIQNYFSFLQDKCKPNLSSICTIVVTQKARLKKMEMTALIVMEGQKMVDLCLQNRISIRKWNDIFNVTRRWYSCFFCIY